MISKSAIRKYLTKERENYYWIKKVRKHHILEQLEEDDRLHEFKIDPYEYQVASLYLGVNLDSFLYFLDMGLGKTKVSIEIYKNRHLCGEVDRCLVLTKNDDVVYSWVDEIEKHSDLVAVPVVGSKVEKLKLLSEYGSGDIYVASYYTVKSIIDYKKGKKPGNILILGGTEFFTDFDMLVFDEIHLCKNSESINFLLCEAISDRIPMRYGLTGTPFNRNPIDLWSQFQLVDKGETLGSFSMYKEAFFRSKITYFGQVWEFNSRKKRLLNKIIKNRSIRYSSDRENLIDLPRVVRIIKSRKFIASAVSQELIDFYKGAIDKYIRKDNKFEKGVVELENTFMKLRQIASGFVSWDDETEEGDIEKQIIDFSRNPKLEMLKEVIEDTDEKVIVFYTFTHSGRKICEMLKELKIGHVWKWSGTSKDKTMISKFRTDRDCRVLVAQWNSVGVGLNLQFAPFAVFYESPISSIDRKQCEGRITKRTGNKRVFIYDLVIERTVDERIAEFLKKGSDLFSALIEGSVDIKDLM